MDRLARRGSTLMPIVGASLRGIPASCTYGVSHVDGECPLGKGNLGYREIRRENADE
jgi:hypothetical protein